jgi:hypothetical protein
MVDLPRMARCNFTGTALVLMLAPVSLRAQASDSIALANAYVARAESLAKVGDTSVYRQALGLLDSAATHAWTSRVVLARLRVSVPYAERLIQLARQARDCPTARQAATIAAIAERSTPSDDVGNVPWILDFSMRAVEVRDAVPRLVRALCSP